MKKILLYIVFTIYSLINFAQGGKLLVIGGGSEKDTQNSWNHKAYKWAIDQSTTKRVAIISFYDSDSWLPNYFVNECGATAATNFKIDTRTLADNQTTYDDLKKYDVVFIKGGDQYNYYSTYKGTKTQTAIEEIFSSGGVVCGTSAGLAVLSDVIFTAEQGSAYPDKVIQNTEHYSITLANDFLSFFPNAIFDSHFTRRGRLGRLVAFMANWQNTNNQQIMGIGIDEMTAIAIDQNNIGTVYGVGAAVVVYPPNEGFIQNTDHILLTDSLKISHLIQGNTIDFNTNTITGFSAESTPPETQETANFTVFMSGSDVLANNTEMLSHFLSATGDIADQVVMVTTNTSALANEYKAELAKNAMVHLFATSTLSASDTEFMNVISSAQKFLFVDNSHDVFVSFMLTNPNGQALLNKLKSAGSVSAFVGNNSRFVGKAFVKNHLSADATYYGELDISEGLALLKTTAVMPQTFLNEDVMENTSAGLPYTLANENLKYGLWLNSANYVKYSPNSENKTYFEAFGQSPVMLLRNDGTKVGFLVQTAYGDGQDDPPNFTGFEQMTLTFFNQTNPVKVGDYTTTGVPEMLIESREMSFFYDSVTRQIVFNEANQNETIRIFDVSGKQILTQNTQNKPNIDVSFLPKGIYLAKKANEVVKFCVK